MCIAATNDDEQRITSTIYFVIAESLQIDVQHIRPEKHLRDDLDMTPEKQQELTEFIMHLFNDYQLDFTRINTVQDLVEQVLSMQRGLPDYPAAATTNSFVE